MILSNTNQNDSLVQKDNNDINYMGRKRREDIELRDDGEPRKEEVWLQSLILLPALLQRSQICSLGSAAGLHLPRSLRATPGHYQRSTGPGATGGASPSGG